jgi:hypothetical protein
MKPRLVPRMNYSEAFSERARGPEFSERAQVLPFIYTGAGE